MIPYTCSLPSEYRWMKMLVKLGIQPARGDTAHVVVDARKQRLRNMIVCKRGGGVRRSRYGTGSIRYAGETFSLLPLHEKHKTKLMHEAFH